MRRREIAGPATQLYSEITTLAADYLQQEQDTNPTATLKRWQLAVLRLAQFLQQSDTEESGSALRAMRLVEDLSHFLESVRKGRPTFADNLVRPPGQQVSMGKEHDLVRCSFAMTCLINAGDSKKAAAQKIAKAMKSGGIPLPPRRGRGKNSIEPWKSLDNWRDKLISAEKGSYLYKQYAHQLEKVNFTQPEQWRSYATDILRLLGSARGNP
jgi:hypothetical protein